MRESFEKLGRSKSCVARLCYLVLRSARILFPTEMRQRVKACFFKVTRHRPSFCRRVTEWGLNKTPRSPRVIVSLTSYPKRIGTVHRTIETLLTQDFKPDMVVLWLGEDRFPNKEADLPAALLRLRDFGLTIGWTKDIRSYTKLVPALKAYPDDIIVTADDDLFYRMNWLKALVHSCEKDAAVIHCHLVRKIQTTDGLLLPYRQWPYGQVSGEATFDNLPMGFAGVLYPPHVLYNDVDDEAKFLALAPCADDLWFWAMAVQNGTQIKLIEDSCGEPTADCATDNSRALVTTNVGLNKNDSQMRAILESYPNLQDRLKLKGN